ncbi:unnamed protein product [Kuraishia capsulata CBS 1993]|uniref:ATP synthase subunit 4 n=1 Tax=Kuraishia capsulata CBS 1993 TaxID=1382522 RepID=W6MHI4_9ASCO|nr:uncharacterized protein KUCA_T00001125001 [Kuraishia capsulata CBS 1993]CDK25158.1 unnamed protein product [Kuraishia capsulata CBS 1993]
MLAQRLALRAPEPKAKATSLIDSLPGNSPLTKTGILATTAAGAIYAISNELYVVNDESILLTTFTGFVLLVVKVVAPLYNDWASGTIKNITDVLNSSRTKHVDAVKERIDQVSELKDVVATTKALFEISKETAALEAEAFELKQQVEIAHEAKSVLDSWVRYESQVRQLEQQQLATSVIAKVQAEIGNPKFQEKLLAQSVEEIEALFAKEK